MARSSFTMLMVMAAVASRLLLFAVGGEWRRSSSPEDGGVPPTVSSPLPDLRPFVDPKSIVDPESIVRKDAPPTKSLPPFHHLGCVERQTIVGISRAVRGIQQSGIRAFPRNGFLLGVVRHGGFLPNEKTDADLGVISSDLEKLELEPSKEGFVAQVPGFSLVLRRCQRFWNNWKGLDPVSGEPYPFFGVTIHATEVEISLEEAYSFYPYRDTGAFFYPWATMYLNHKARLADGIRYNAEGGDLRLVDTDERLNAKNYKEGAQMGNVFDTNLTCFEEVQFYFTTIPIPCDYKKILTSLYGGNWPHAETRGENGTSYGGPKYSAKVVTNEMNEQLLRGGPRPICKH